MTGNIIAAAALALWPLVTLWLFSTRPAATAYLVAVLGGYLALPPAPAAFDLPGLPPFDKYMAVNLSVLAGFLLNGGRWRDLVPDSRLLRLLAALFVLSPVATVATNGEPVVFAIAALPPLGARDAVALCVIQASLLAAFLVGLRLLRGPDAPALVMRALMIGGLIYAVPMLLEVRLSPQLNIWIYGYFQASFDQMIRDGGFRPLVFLEHAIWAAFFMAVALVAAVSLWRQPASPNRPAARLASAIDATPPAPRADPAPAAHGALLAAGFLAGVLVAAKTLAPMLHAALLVPAVAFLSPRRQLLLALVLGGLALAWPAARALDAVPQDFLLTRAAAIDPERAASLKFRFDNEVALYDRAMEKPLFGWGSWGRGQLHNPVDGTLTSVTDGRWIITLGNFGWVGFIAEFGLLLAPVLLLWRASRACGRIPPHGGALALILAANMVDLIPNATLTPITWLVAATLAGQALRLRTGAAARDTGARPRIVTVMPQ